MIGNDRVLLACFSGDRHSIFGHGKSGFGGFGPVTPPGLTAVHFNLSILGQGETNVVTNFLGTATVTHFQQARIDDDDILGLINKEFGTSFSATNGDHLAVSNFGMAN